MPSYRIGAVLAASGKLAFVGAPEKETLESLEQRINRDGGLDGVPIHFDVRDSRSDPQRALSAVQELCSQGSTLAIIGPSTTDETLAVLEQVESRRVPCLSLASSNRSQPQSPWVFKLAQMDHQAVQRIYDHLARKRIRRVSLLTVETHFGRGGRADLVREGPDFGIEILSEGTFPVGPLSDETCRQALRQVMAARPQAVVVWGSGLGPADLVRTARKLGLGVPLLCSHGIASREFVERAGAASEGVLFPAGPLLVADQLPDSHPQKRELERYRVFLSGRESTTFGGHAWDAAHLLFEAVRAVGPDRAKIRAYVENLQNHAGTTGVYSFSPQDHNGLTYQAFVLLRIADGRWRLEEL